MKSIYTFNAVTSLCFVAEWEGYIVTGSGEGVAVSMCENVCMHLAMCNEYVREHV